MKTHIHAQAHMVKCGSTHTHTYMYAYTAKCKESGRDGEIRMKREKMNSRIISLISLDLTEVCGWDGWSPWKNRAYSLPPAPHSPIPPNPLPIPPFKRDYGKMESERERVRASLLGRLSKAPRSPEILSEKSARRVWKRKTQGFKPRWQRKAQKLQWNSP